jgi:hypothetical protein
MRCSYIAKQSKNDAIQSANEVVAMSRVLQNVFDAKLTFLEINRRREDHLLDRNPARKYHRESVD